MDKIRIRGSEIVENGAKRTNVVFPAAGLKEITPNGSWLERKEIQTTLENKKDLVDILRIERSSLLNHAVWHEDIKLAEVTEQIGGIWQFFGVTYGKKLHLYPEEALLLMELNLLKLTYNNITVSLQQAYSLLLENKHSLILYQVYVSLSRIGYKVLRHRKHENINAENDCNGVELLSDTDRTQKVSTKSEETVAVINNDVKISSTQCEDEVRNDSHTLCNAVTYMEHQDEACSGKQLVLSHSKKVEDNKDKKVKRKIFKNCNNKTIHSCFDNLPDFYQKHFVTIPAPDKSLIPAEISLTKLNYDLNIYNIRKFNTIQKQTEKRMYSSTDGGANISRIRSSDENKRNENYWVRQSLSFSQQQSSFTSSFRPDVNYFPINTRLYLSNLPNFHNYAFMSRLHYFSGLRPLMNASLNVNVDYGNNLLSNVSETIRESVKKIHLDAIKKVSFQLKHIFTSRNPKLGHLHTLQKLIYVYNSRYGERLCLNDELDLVQEERLLETIELEDDEPSAKRIRLDETNRYTQNFDKLRQIACRLKKLEANNKITPRHRRAFTNAVKTFNKFYNAETVVNRNFEITDKNYITLDSSSDDCIVEELPRRKKVKKLRNPFNILKRLSRKDSIVNTEPSKSADITVVENTLVGFKYNESTINTFGKNWLPTENDFARVEVTDKKEMKSRLYDSCTVYFIYDFLKSNPYFENWHSAKSAFWNNFENTVNILENKHVDLPHVAQESIVQPEDCIDMNSVMKKLRVIASHKEEINYVSNLKVDFDVYNRDIQNFKKTDPPKPSFRVICIESRDNLPSVADLAAFCDNYNDNVTTLFAVVESGMVSFVQKNPIDLLVYKPTDVLD